MNGKPDGVGRGTDENGISMGRRSLLGALAAAGLAGCSGGDGDSEDTATQSYQTVDRSTPTPTPTQTPTEEATPTPAPTVPGDWPQVEDPYYRQLIEEFHEMGLPAGEFLYADNEADTLDAFSVWAEIGETESIPVDSGLPFSAALRFTITEKPDDPWSVTMNGPVEDHAVNKGDVLLGVVNMRKTAGSPNPPTIRSVVKDENHSGANMVYSDAEVEPPSVWTRYYVPIKYEGSADAGNWWWEMYHGFGQQETDVGGVALIYFGQDASVEDLPSGAVDT
ncbi:hypothetical protein [Halosimplex sp. J119]